MDSASLAPLRATSSSTSTSSAPRADTFGASSGTPPPGTSVPGFEVLSSPNGPNSFSFNGLTGGPGSLSLVLCPFQEALRRLKSVDEASSGSLFCKRNTPFFRTHLDASTAFLTDPLPSKTTMLPLSNTPDTASKRLADLGSLECHSTRDVASAVLFGTEFHREFSQIVYLFTSRAHVSWCFH